MIILASSEAVTSAPSLFELLVRIPLLKPYAETILFWEDIFFSLIIAGLISLAFYFGGKKKEKIPVGFQNFLEWIVESIRGVVKSVLGNDADKNLPFIGTIFIYILSMNLFSLIPFMKSPSSNLSISIALAICVFLRVQFLHFKNMGLMTYLYHLAGSPKSAIEWGISPLMFCIELITQISRPITLALRLTGNIMGEHILISVAAMFAAAVFTFEYLPFGLPIQLPAMLFSILTSVMQAMVFTLLTTMYILLSSPHGEESH